MNNDLLQNDSSDAAAAERSEVGFVELMEF